MDVFYACGFIMVCVCLAAKGLRGRDRPLCLGGPLCHCCAGIELAAPHLTTAKQ